MIKDSLSQKYHPINKSTPFDLNREVVFFKERELGGQSEHRMTVQELVPERKAVCLHQHGAGLPNVCC